ncbi:MAG: type II toxin-antitoxin system HicA family toxin [Candidatus Omnitrophica bacterium]|nr:type II toxin-antitoxin system HicA family toxin [Candidatus Omnitrophota bacterium]
MKIPRDIGGKDLAKALSRYGYSITRQTGSHLRLTTQLDGEHHVTIPAHQSLRLGTLSAILTEVAQHLKRDRSELTNELWG